jgi:hypothetical protein
MTPGPMIECKKTLRNRIPKIIANISTPSSDPFRIHISFPPFQETGGGRKFSLPIFLVTDCEYKTRVGKGSYSYRATVPGIERGKQNISLANVGKIARALKITPEKLLKGVR